MNRRDLLAQLASTYRQPVRPHRRGHRPRICQFLAVPVIQSAVRRASNRCPPGRFPHHNWVFSLMVSVAGSSKLFLRSMKQRERLVGDSSAEALL